MSSWLREFFDMVTWRDWVAALSGLVSFALAMIDLWKAVWPDE